MVLIALGGVSFIGLLCRRSVLRSSVILPYRTAMTEGKHEEHWISKVNQQVGYSRQFLAPEKVLVTIPTLPYNAFDLYLSGTRIKPWNLIDLIVSVRLFTQFPVQHSGNPDDSIVDIHHLQTGNLSFVSALKMEISKIFHSPNAPKFPLLVEANVTHVGNSSSRRRYTVMHPSMYDSPYITCEIDDTIVSKVTRRPTHFPEWWIKKYSYLKRNKTKFPIPSKSDFSSLNRSEFLVEFEDLDHNLHTTMSAYLKFCVNAVFKTLQCNKYGHISLDYMKAGLKCIQMFFHNESGYGDKLEIEVLGHNKREPVLYIEINKLAGKSCCTVILDFYEPTKHMVPGKL